MTISTPQSELDAVNAAIEAILTAGQSYSINNQSFTRANLNELFARKAVLEARIAAQSRGGFKKVPVFKG